MSSYYIFDKTDGSLDKLTSDLDAGKHIITNLKTYPENNSDATSKKYVDDEVAKKLSLSGGVMTGILNMSGFIVSNIPAPYNDHHVTRKKYVDDEVAKSLPLTGGTMSGNINMANYSITNIPKPSGPQDPTSKSYVDDEVAKKLSLSGGTMTGVLNTSRLTTTGYESKDSRSYRQFYIANPKNVVAGWFLGNQSQAPTTSDNDLYFTVRYTSGNYRTSGFISDAESNVKMNFTGQHRCRLEGPNAKPLQGMIVEATGKYYNFGGGTSPTINDSLPIVRICDTPKSKKVFGVFSETEDPNKRELVTLFLCMISQKEMTESLSTHLEKELSSYVALMATYKTVTK